MNLNTVSSLGNSCTSSSSSPRIPDIFTCKRFGQIWPGQIHNASFSCTLSQPTVAANLLGHLQLPSQPFPGYGLSEIKQFSQSTDSMLFDKVHPLFKFLTSCQSQCHSVTRPRKSIEGPSNVLHFSSILNLLVLMGKLCHDQIITKLRSGVPCRVTRVRSVLTYQ